MGHISSSNTILANDDFYRFNIDKIIRGDEMSESTIDTVPEDRRSRLGIDLATEKRFKRRKAMLLKNHFEMIVEMNPSGEKIFKINFDQPKVLARADIFLMIGDFFRSGFPAYTEEQHDKPNGWTNDPNSQRR